MKSEHESILQSTINELRKQGFRVIRLDHRIVPDAIAIKERSVSAIEVETSMTGLSLTRRKFDGSQYDDEIIVTRPLNPHYHKMEVYNEAIALSKANKSYREIRRFLKEKYALETLAISTIHDWIKGKQRPIV